MGKVGGSALERASLQKFVESFAQHTVQHHHLIHHPACGSAKVFANDAVMLEQSQVRGEGLVALFRPNAVTNLCRLSQCCIATTIQQDTRTVDGLVDETVGAIKPHLKLAHGPR